MENNFNEQEEFDKDSPFYDKIALWKKNFKTIYELVLHDDNGNKFYAYFKQPDRMVMMHFYTYFSKDKMMACETLYNTCKLESSDEIDLNDGMYLSVLLKMPELIDFYSSNLKKN
jgi:hypothetical protein